MYFEVVGRNIGRKRRKRRIGRVGSLRHRIKKVAKEERSGVVRLGRGA